MHLDPIIPLLTGTILAILVLGMLLNRLKIPYVVAYLLAGLVIGPYGFNLIQDPQTLHLMESIGVLLLLFFVGMEISIPKLIASWRVAIIGTLLQILISLGCVALIGHFFDWETPRIVLLGLVISLSSTAVILKMLQEWGELDSEVGQDVLGVLLVQDIAIVPMLITIEHLGGNSPSNTDLILQIIGGLLIIGIVVFITIKKEFKIPFGSVMRKNHELQVFAGLVICFGLAFVTSLFQLSGALGAFVAGLVVRAGRETTWTHKVIEPFYVLFVALFFVSIGILVDLHFIRDNYVIILLLLTTTFLTNTFINAGILRLLKANWRKSLYGGAILSQIGEFSFVLIAVGYKTQIIAEFGYKLAISIISLSLMLSPAWIIFMKKITKPNEPT